MPDGVLISEEAPGRAPDGQEVVERRSKLRAGRVTLVVVVLVVVIAGVILAVTHPWTSPIPNPVLCAETACTSAGPHRTTATFPIVPLTEPLLFEIPVAVHGPFFQNCEEDPASAFVTAAVQEQVACNTGNVSSMAEDYEVYMAFGSAADADSYFEDTLVHGNGLEDGIGDCILAVLPGVVGKTGNYCVESPGLDGVGRILGVQGAAFSLGNGTDVSQVCAGSGVEATGHSFAVAAWTDPHAPVVEVAVSCGGSVFDIAADLWRGKLVLVPPTS